MRKKFVNEEYLRQEDFRAKSATPVARQRLYDCPKPLPDECFSSWLSRTAANYNMPAEKLLRTCFGIKAWRHIMIDQDICLPDNLHRLLGSLTTYGSEIFEGMLHLTRPHLNYPAIEWLDENLKFARKLSKFCPDCLQSDEIPYFRNKWRFAKTLRCETHGTLLESVCPHCSLPVAPARQALPSRPRGYSLGNCPYCSIAIYTASTKVDRKISEKTVTSRSTPIKEIGNDDGRTSLLATKFSSTNIFQSDIEIPPADICKPLDEQLSAIDLTVKAGDISISGRDRLKHCIDHPELAWLAIGMGK